MSKPAKIEYPSGVIKVNSLLASMGRYVDADKIRFWQGHAETIGGWQKWNTTPTPGVTRSMLAWSDTAGNNFLAVGSTEKLYVYTAQNKVPIDITPILPPISGVSTLPTGSPFTVIAGSTSVQVTHASHGLKVGQHIHFSGATTVGGLDMNSEWVVVLVDDGNHYHFNHTNLSGASTTGGGPANTVTYQYEIPPGNVDFIDVTTGGWGMGAWGGGPWGGGGTTQGLGEPRHWSLALWGTLLTASYPAGTVYTWTPDPLSTTRAAAIANAPLSMRAHIVTESRFILCFGTTGGLNDPLAMTWQDQDTLTVWTPTTTNTAGSRRLQGGTRIVAGTPVQSLGNLVWTDTAVFMVTFTGSKFVFDSQIAGRGCGLVGPKAFCVGGSIAYWMGPAAFHRWVGYAEDIPRQEEMYAWFIRDLNLSQQRKVFCYYSSLFGEVTWFYPGDITNEPTRYLTVSLEDYSWTPGTMSRTAVAQFDTGDVRPIMIDLNGYLYRHEAGNNADGAPMPWMLQAAPLEIQDGEVLFDVDGYIPNFFTVSGTVDIQLDAYDRIPDDVTTAPIETQVRTYTASSPDRIVDFSINGRAIGVKLSSSTMNSSMRLGTAKLDVQSRGDRR